MAEYNIKGLCKVCDGTNERFLWDGSVDEDGNAIPPEASECTYCTGGKVTVFTANMPLDDILDKCNDILNKCNDIFEKVNE